MAVLVGSEWGQYDFIYRPQQKQPKLNLDLETNISILVGYFPSGNRFGRVLVDTDGRLLVTTGASKTGTGNTSAVVVGVASVALLADNPNRRSYAIKNLGANMIYLGFGTGGVVATGYPVLPNQEFADDTFTGAINAISSVAGNDVRVLEF